MRKYKNKNPSGFKTCPCCGIEKSLEEGYYKATNNNNNGAIYYFSLCKICKLEKAKSISNEKRRQYIETARCHRIAVERNKNISKSTLSSWEDDCCLFVKRLIRKDFIIYGQAELMDTINDLITYWRLVQPRDTMYDMLKFDKQISYMVRDLVAWYNSR